MRNFSYNYIIYNILGEIIYFNGISNNQTIDFIDWNPGIYFMALETKNKMLVRKFIIK